MPKTQPKRPKRRKPLWKLAIAPENYRAQARTLTETLETLRQTGETHAKNTEFRNSNLDLLNWMSCQNPRADCSGEIFTVEP
ncbi:hypothetical protein ACVXG7_02850 [Enterobacter hormaechei]